MGAGGALAPPVYMLKNALSTTVFYFFFGQTNPKIIIECVRTVFDNTNVAIGVYVGTVYTSNKVQRFLH
jgi:hypothetical protein